MTITFNFFFPLVFLYWTWLTWIFFILLTLAYLFLILGSKDLKKHNFASTKLLFIIGIILLVWYILERLVIPSISLSSPTPMEIIIAYIYNLFLGFGIVYQVLHIILGIGFIKVGSNNREHGGTVILVGGILYLITWILNMVGNIILLTSAVFSIPIPFGYILYVLNWIAYVTMIAAVILIFIFSIFTKRALFIIFGSLFLAIYSFQFLLFIGLL
ncbi:MAG: hypothetical protein ACFFB4_07660 [Promethearchaeota archaeon]